MAGDPDRLGWFKSYLVDLLRFHLRRTVQPERARVDHEAKVDGRYLEYRRFRASRQSFLEKVRQLRDERSTLDWSPQNGVNVVSAYIHEDFEINTYQWKLLERILGQFKREVDSIDSRLIVMLLPVPFNPRDPRTIAGGEFEFTFATPDGTFTFRAAEPRDRLIEIATHTGIELYDPTARFIDRITADGLVEASWPDRDDTHLSPIGHRILAEMFHEYLTGDTP